MKVNFSNVSFQRYTPVRIYIKNRLLDSYGRATYPDKVKRCGHIISKHLNKGMKNTNEDFVKYYESYDRDYKNNPKAYTIYDVDTSNMYLATSQDAYALNEFGKSVGLARKEVKDREALSGNTEFDNIAEKEARDYFGHMEGYMENIAKRNYFSNSRKYLKNHAKRVKDVDGNSLVLNAYFDIKYDKDGLEKNYIFKGAEFVKSPDFGFIKEEPDLSMKPQVRERYRQITVFDILNEQERQKKLDIYQ